MAELKMEEVRISEILEYGNNPRNNDKAIEPVMNSIRKFGYVSPIIIDEENMILAGHTRIKALREMGIEEVDVIRLRGLSPEERKSYRIADNRTGEFSSWDGDLLEAEMREIKADDWQKFGFKETEIRKIKSNDLCKCPRCGQTFVKV